MYQPSAYHVRFYNRSWKSPTGHRARPKVFYTRGRGTGLETSNSTHLSSMPWLHLSFMLTITSRGCIFLSPLHSGVVTLPREFTPGTNDGYVRPHTYASLRDDAMTSSAWRDDEINVFLCLPPCRSTHAGSIRGDVRVTLGASTYIHTYERARGLRQSRIVASLRRALLHCHGARAPLLYTLSI